MLWQFLVLLTVHWIADFVLQTSWQAENKSKRLDALAWHVGVYTGVLAVAAIVLFGIEGAPFAAVNGSLHFTTDYFTSRLNSRLYAKAYPTQRWHNFFVSVGFDQLIHQITLGTTMWLLLVGS